MDIQNLGEGADMIYFTLGLWLLTGLFVLFEKNMVRIVIWMGLLSIIAALIFLLLGSPDVAMAEAVISTFTTTFLIICFEKYFGLRNMQNLLKEEEEVRKESIFKRTIFPLVFTLFLAGLFIYFVPGDYFNSYLKELYLTRFSQDIGGQNAVTSIYLGYRVYDTLLEALMLIIAAIAVRHMSHFGEATVKDGEHSELEESGIALILLRMVAPVTIVFGVYLIANGSITAGGGFQGGLAVAGFFICRYMIYNIYDVRIEKINKMEELVFVAITIIAVLIVFQGAVSHLPPHLVPIFQNIYLLLMNGLIGAKVACGFIILFYRYVAIERN